MLSNDIIKLLSINHEGLFKDHERCFELLANKRNSGDEDTPEELTEEPIFNLSGDLFIWVAEQNIHHGNANRVATDIMSNVSSQADADLSETYATMVNMLAKAGHLQHAIRIRRAHVAGHVDAYREFQRAGKVVSRYDAMTPAQQVNASASAKPDRFQRSMANKFPERKELVLKAIGIFEKWLQDFDALNSFNEQLKLWKDEVINGQKSKLPPADKTPMTEALFWKLVETDADTSESEALLEIEERLVAYSAKAIRDAYKMLQSVLSETYKKETWALAYLLQDGCSDDSFHDFRCWMVLQGQDVFKTILDTPDTYDPASFNRADTGAAGCIMSSFENAYLRRAGKPISIPAIKRENIEIKEDEFAKLLPTIASRMAT